MKGVLELNINYLIFLIVILVVIGGFLLSIIMKIGSQQNLSSGCVSIGNAILSMIRPQIDSSAQTKMPNALWC